MFYQIFLSPQVKRSLIISNKLVYTSCRTTWDLRKLGKFWIMPNLHRSITQCPVFLPKRKFCQYQQKAPWKYKLNFSCSTLFHMKTRVFLKYFVRACNFYMIRVFSGKCFRTDFKIVFFLFSPLMRTHDLTWQYINAGQSMNALCTFNLVSVFLG